jgi:hypothetical protein
MGSRSVSGIYAVPPRQFLFRNNGKGIFEEVTKAVAPDLHMIGMVTDAVLTDVTGDRRPELVVVGEWMTPRIFSIENGQFQKVETNLDQFSGWWYALQADDVDGDGDQDLILGNRGENFYFSGDQEAPSKIWIWDFDGNGTMEKIMTRNVGGKDLPIPMKKELTSQLPGLKKQNLKHTDYARKSIQDLFPSDILKKAIVRRGNYFKSAVAINNGNGQFDLKPLPAPVQFSCVKAIQCVDLDGDGKKDLLLGGNDSGFMPQFSRLDASFGHVLLNRGGGNFERVENRVSGFFARGDMKQITSLRKGSELWFLALMNNQKPLVFRQKAGVSR